MTINMMEHRVSDSVVSQLVNVMEKPALWFIWHAFLPAQNNAMRYLSGSEVCLNRC